jgi:hypothetical protein
VALDRAPTIGRVKPILPIFARLWRGFAGQALGRLEDVLV